MVCWTGDNIVMLISIFHLISTASASWYLHTPSVYLLLIVVKIVFRLFYFSKCFCSVLNVLRRNRWGIKCNPRKPCLKYLLYCGMVSYPVQSLKLHYLNLSSGIKCGTLKTVCEQLFQSINGLKVYFCLLSINSEYLN